MLPSLQSSVLEINTQDKITCIHSFKKSNRLSPMVGTGFIVQFRIKNYRRMPTLMQPAQQASKGVGDRGKGRVVGERREGSLPFPLFRTCLPIPPLPLPFLPLPPLFRAFLPPPLPPLFAPATQANINGTFIQGQPRRKVKYSEIPTSV